MRPMSYDVPAMASCSYCRTPYPDGATYCASCGQPVAAVAAPAAPAPSGGSTKMVIIAAVGGGCLLLALFIGGIVAALVIPNFLDALQRAKQKRTIADARVIAAALEGYREQTGNYPAADGAEVGPMLAAHGYTGTMEDGWKHPLRYACLSPADGACASYELASGGSDGVFEQDPGGYAGGESFETTAYESDIVLSDGMFTRWPSGQGRSATGGG